MVDVLIVGQGIAGTLLAYFLKKKGKTVRIIDDGHLSSSSMVAAGFINPVTGRKYTKSWMIDDLIPFAKATYDELSSLLGSRIYAEKNIIRTIPDVRSENNWLARQGDEGYTSYLMEKPSLGLFRDMIFKPFGFGEITRSMQVNMSLLLAGFKEKYSGDILREPFDYGELDVESIPDCIKYKSVVATKIVFSEGYKGKDNPYFNYLPFEGAKGEVLIIRIPGYSAKKILRHKIFIAPIADEKYWVGAGYAWDLTHIHPTDRERQRLVSILDNILRVPYRVEEHRVGVRPSTKDRRPFLGVHPIHGNVFIFNGLGTKGASLGPYWADKMADYIVDKSPLDQVVDISRYKELFLGG